MLPGFKFVKNAFGDQLLHRESLGGRHAHDTPLRSFFLRQHSHPHVLALRGDHVPGRLLLAGRLRLHQCLHVGGHQHRPLHCHYVSVQAANVQLDLEDHDRCHMDLRMHHRISHFDRIEDFHARRSPVQSLRTIRLPGALGDGGEQILLHDRTDGPSVRSPVFCSRLHVHENRDCSLGKGDTW